MNQEIWKPVVGYEGLYEVSSLGRVRGIDRKIEWSHARYGYASRIYPGKYLTPVVSRSYRRVGITDAAGTRRLLPVSNLVAAAFLGPRPPENQVCHNDGNPQNDVLSNLRYDTRAGNHADRVIHGTTTRGEGNGRAKLSAQQVASIRRSTKRTVDLAAELGVCISTVGRARRGFSWRQDVASLEAAE